MGAAAEEGMGWATPAEDAATAMLGVSGERGAEVGKAVGRAAAEAEWAVVKVVGATEEELVAAVAGVVEVKEEAGAETGPAAAVTPVLPSPKWRSV